MSNDPTGLVTESVEIKMAVRVDLQFLADVIITAVEGGINYWSQVVTYRWTEGPIHTHADIIEQAEEDDQPVHHKLDLETIKRGIEFILNNSVVNDTITGYVYDGVRENDSGRIDADAADAIVQAALFGEVRYG